jgi:DNA helicase HerA-like ATPase
MADVSVDFTNKNTVVGRTQEDLLKYKEEGTAYIGKVVMSSGENPVLGRKVLMDVARPHVVLICGKRGGGKSFSLGVMVEEFAQLAPELKKRISVIVIDMVGIFWTLKFPNREDKELTEWGLTPQALDVQILVPKGKLDFYKEKQIPVDGPLTLRAGELDITEWMALFRYNWHDAEAILLGRVIEDVKEKVGMRFGIEEILSAIDLDSEGDALTKQALRNRLHKVKSQRAKRKTTTQK